MGFPGDTMVKNLPASVTAGDPGDMGSISGSRRRKWQPIPVFLPKKSHGQRSLAGCSPWGRKSQTGLRDIGIEVFNLFDYHNVVSFIWVADYTNIYYPVPNYLTARQINIKINASF